MENTNITEFFIGVIINHKGEYFQSFSFHRGNSWTTDIKKAKIYTKLGTARARVTLIYSWNKRKKISEPLVEIRQFFVSGFIDLDQSERITLYEKTQEKQRIEREKINARYRAEAAQREYDKAQAELERLSIKLKTINGTQ